MTFNDQLRGWWTDRICDFWLVKGFFPFLLVAQVVVPVYLVFVRLELSLLASVDTHGDDDWPMYGMASGKGSKVAAISIAVLGFILLLLWTLPLAYCLWSYHWVARRWKPVQAPTIAPLFQVDGESRRRRFCYRCRIYRGDRTYHCRYLDKCLPFYDHNCFWWLGGVWLHNVAAYMVFITFLPVYHLFLVGVSIWALASPERIRHSDAYLSMGIPAVLCLWPSTDVVRQFWRQLFFWNLLCKEVKDGFWFLNDEGNAELWVATSRTQASTNPWNKGWRKNIWAMFSGELKASLECSSQPNDMHEVLTSQDIAPVAIRSDAFEGRTRRSEARSSGYEEAVELGTLVRRTQTPSA